MRRLDLPPIWFLFFVVLALLVGRVDPWAPSWSPLWRWGAGGISTLTGLAFLFAAVTQIRRAKTTLDPAGRPRALVTRGVYRFSRNPIYLGLVLLLLGAVLMAGSWPGLILVPAFATVITLRFIRREEAALARAFGEGFTSYTGRTRRWL